MERAFQLDWFLPLSSLVLLILVTRSVAALPRQECPPIVFAFLISQCVFVGVLTLVGTKWEKVTRHFIIAWALSMIPALTLALGLAAYSLVRAQMRVMLIPLVGLAGFLGQQIESHWGRAHWAYRLNACVGAMFLVAGLFLLLSLDRHVGAVFDQMRLVIGIFLLAEGVFFWLLPEYFATHYEQAVSANAWVPAFVAIGCYLWLGAWLYQRAR